MKMKDVKCRLCGQNAMQAVNRGAYLKRVNPKGEIPCVMECYPNCDRENGGPDDAVLNAIRGE